MVQFLRNVPGGIKKNVAMLLSIALALYLILKIEAVSSLIRNMGLWAVIPFGIALLPLFLSKVIIWSKYAKKHIVPSWDVGGISHRSWRNLAMEPDRLLERWRTSPVEAGSGVFKLRVMCRSVIDSLRKLGTRLKKPESILDIIIKGQIYKLGWYLLGWIVSVFILFLCPKSTTPLPTLAMRPGI